MRCVLCPLPPVASRRPGVNRLFTGFLCFFQVLLLIWLKDILIAVHKALVVR